MKSSHGRKFLLGAADFSCPVTKGFAMLSNRAYYQVLWATKQCQQFVLCWRVSGIIMTNHEGRYLTPGTGLSSWQPVTSKRSFILSIELQLNFLKVLTSLFYMCKCFPWRADATLELELLMVVIAGNCTQLLCKNKRTYPLSHLSSPIQLNSFIRLLLGIL